jgi:rhodanese-related sulfurtransferase
MVVSTPHYVKESIEKDLPLVLVDLRTGVEAKKGFMPGAVSIPLSEISTAKDRFPADKKAPVVLYSDTPKSASEAFRVARGWGFSNTSVLDGGIDAWKKAGNSLATGELKTAIVYVPKPRPGEIVIEEFKKIAETLPGDKVILDVRDEDEAMHGMLKGAKNIPTQEISGKLAELPKDKEIITHCITGVRAEMAYLILKDEGYKVRFLNADIKIDKEGKYEITKE